MFLCRNIVTLVCVVSRKTKLPLYNPHMHVRGKKGGWAIGPQLMLYPICWWELSTTFVCLSRFGPTDMVCLGCPFQGHLPQVWNMMWHCFLWHTWCWQVPQSWVLAISTSSNMAMSLSLFPWLACTFNMCSSRWTGQEMIGNKTPCII